MHNNFLNVLPVIMTFAATEGVLELRWLFSVNSDDAADSEYCYENLDEFNMTVKSTNCEIYQECVHEALR